MTGAPVRIARTPHFQRGIRLVALVGAAAIGTATHPFGWTSTAVVAGLTVAVLVRAVRRPSEPIPASARLRNGVLLWSACALAVVGWELFALSRQAIWSVPDPNHPTISTLLSPVLEHGPGRFVGWLAWLAVAWRWLR
ncbi:hypothetical protein [Nocardia aurantiaca]|uniref:Uncharacterized protein n=1 Tax=Nocardia aurantiaca TaxID=2675850 RepID=A0A6I3LA99_9NOCA|nr:hypothetical protein [Nocardia aurantiaca]MTE16769.1 hypothetical protein [Nocardia aurantiaca]